MDAHLQAFLLGVLEAATEFLPISSTGHLILLGKLIGFEGKGAEVFDVAIQLGAILAICLLYFTRLWNVLIGLPTQPQARRFAAAVLLAFLPAAFLGALLHDFIKSVLFSPYVVCVALIVGGVAILLAEKYAPKAKIHSVEAMDWKLSLKIGFCQCLAMIPGVSRSGASILGAILMGLDRKVATEFSFFLAIPTMFGATVFDLFKARHDLAGGDMTLIAIGFVTAFVFALPIVKWFVGFVSRHGFAPFAYYRMVLGAVGLLALMYL